MPLILRDPLFFHNLALHRHYKALKSIELGLSLHLTEFTAVSNVFILAISVWEGAVQRVLDILLDQTARFRGLITSSDPLY